MHLLNAITLKLEHFTGIDTPPYAILSHRWYNIEVSFQDIEQDIIEAKKSYKKIRQCCAQALIDGYNYVWIDTCCIDKKSSTELSEAILSMYHWYSRADVCYAYLADIETTVDVQVDGSFTRSEWFTRGWTLQELIAPNRVLFFSSDWVHIGSKSEYAQEISLRTNIKVEVLKGESPETCSIAQRMCWASQRKTTRVEDTAYCLLGIFGVQMPMLYGEGERAFSRLQEEILKRSNDHSIFAWREPENLSNSYGALLARSPACFVNSGNIVPFHDWRAIGKKGGSSSGKEFQITNRGLRILLYTRLVPMNSSLYYAALNCRVVDNTAFTSPGPVWIFLHCISVLDSEYVRVRPEIFADGISQRRLKREADVVYIKRGIPAPPNNKKMFEFHIRPQKFNLLGISHVQNTSVSPLRWNLEEMRIGVPYSHVGLVGTMSYGRNGEISLVVMLSFSSEFGGVVDVFRATDKVDHIKQRLSIGKSKGHTTIQEGIVMVKTSTVRRTQLVDIFVFPIYI